jgi:transcriptional regulator
MYIPASMKMADIQAAHDFITEFSFGILVTASLTGSHLPFLLHREEAELGTLYSHFARANPHWKEIAGQEAVVIFSGPHAYISPSWYEAVPAVPTWNYAAVHAYGTVTLLDDAGTLAVVEESVATYEPRLLIQRNIVTEEVRDKLLPAVVGFKLELSRLEGKQKLGQHRGTGDQVGVYQALAGSSRLDDQALARYMDKVNLGKGTA